MRHASHPLRLSLGGVQGRDLVYLERRVNTAQFGNGTIRGLGTALSWSAVTMASVGYGDVIPRTPRTSKPCAPAKNPRARVADSDRPISGALTAQLISHQSAKSDRPQAG